MEFKDKLKKLRTDNGLSQEALADAVHISRSAIAKYENGNGNPSEETFKALALFFGVEADELRSDDAVKARKNNKALVKVGIIATAVLLLGGIASGITLGVINLNRGGQNPSSGVDETIITGIDAKVGIPDSAEPVRTMVNPNTKEKFYYVNTFLDFSVEVYPRYHGSQVPVLRGDCVTFKHDTSFSSSAYVQSEYNPSYRLEFKKEGTYRLDYTTPSFENHLNFIIDNSVSAWDGFKTTIKEVCPWANGVAKSNIQSLRYEYSNGSLGPDFFREVYYSSDEGDIESAYGFLDSQIYKTNRNLAVPGMGTATLEYTLDNVAETKSVSIVGRQFANPDERYLIGATFGKPFKPSERRFMINPIGGQIKAVSKKTGEEAPFDSLFDLEFVDWPDAEPHEEIEPAFEIKGHAAEILVFAPKRFSYNGKMLKVLSTKDFSVLFA